MSALIFNWLAIFIIAAVLSYLWKSWSAFQAGALSFIIAAVITGLVHSFWVPSGDFIWALIAVSHASYWSGFFTSINTRKV